MKYLLSVLLLCVLTGCGSKSEPEDGPARDLSICEAVFRHLLVPTDLGEMELVDSAEAASPFYIFLSVRGEDPDERVFRLLSDVESPVLPGSLAEQTEGGWIVNSDNGGAGAVLYIDEIRTISDDEAEVDGGRYAGPTSATGETYTVKKIKGKWRVTGEKRHWISCIEHPQSDPPQVPI